MTKRSNHWCQSRTVSRRGLILALGLACAIGAQAQTVKTWSVATGDFFGNNNWSPTGAPAGTDIALINNGGTGTIAGGSHDFGAIRLGDTQDGAVSGHVIMDGGTLHIGSTQGDPKALIGFSAQLSSFIMNGGTIYFDGPDRADIAGSYSGKGINELDWEVGEKGLGLFEMRGSSAFFGADDLKVAENAAGNGTTLITDNAHLAVGSGISVSGGGAGPVEQLLTIGGNAVVDSGNSMGAGSPLGHTDEGYLTVATGGSTGKVVIQENGVLNIRRLTAREGGSTIIVKDHGQFHIFDVLAGKGGSVTPAERPTETGPNSTYASLAPSDATLLLQDDAQMTVNSDPVTGPTKGLGISAQRDFGNSGGKARLIVRDRASLRIEQDLMVGTGRNPDTSDGTLEVVGPDAVVSIGGNLNLAVDLDGIVTGEDPVTFTPRACKAALSAVITGPTHAIVNVGGTARIANGTLRLKTDGYTVPAGASYTIVKASGSPAFDGEFAHVDVSGAAVPTGHTWSVEYTADSVVVRVVPGPGRPDDNGLAPKTGTLYVNTPPSINNGNTESLGVAIASNNNVIVGWEDDSDVDPLLYNGAVWTIYGPTGEILTPETERTSVVNPGVVLTRHLSWFRPDGSAVYGDAAWGPKIKANPWGPGIGMGATAYALSAEVPGMEPWEDTTDDISAVQLLTDSGQPSGILPGIKAEFATRTGAMRIGDWDYLSNGNVVIVTENRQSQDLVDLFGGTDPWRHIIFRIVAPNGTVVKEETLVTASANQTRNHSMWHGVGVTANGFAVRWEGEIEGLGAVMIRLFDNAGNPVTGDIPLATLAGDPAAGGGGRGDGAGFHGNGTDAYVAVCGAGTAAQVTVINADGTLRWTKSVGADANMKSVGQADAAISPSGEVVVVWSGSYEGGPTDENLLDLPGVFGQVLAPNGDPVGGPFLVGERETGLMKAARADSPRVARRGNMVAITWESFNSGILGDPEMTGFPSPINTVALRILNRPAPLTPTTFSSITQDATSVTLTWTGGAAPFVVQKKTSLNDADWADVLTTSERSATVPKSTATGFYRIKN